MRVVSASRRTDIPAFYSRWLVARLRAGFCHVANPFGGQVLRVALRPEDVVALVLFTRDPRPLLRHLPALTAEGYRVYAHVTVNGYPRTLEPRSPWLPRATSAVGALADAIGADSVVWRYDPIVLTDETPEGWHIARFAGIADRLEGATRECVISFVDRYKKTERNLDAAGIHPDWEVGERHLALAAELRGMAAERGIELRACAEEALGGAGIPAAACLDRERVAAMRPDLGPRLRVTPTRPGCGCCESIDIGAYDTCGFGCAFCYATETPALGLTRLREHDPADSILWRPPSLRDVDLDAVAG
jgi:hypothetical protein